MSTLRLFSGGVRAGLLLNLVFCALLMGMSASGASAELSVPNVDYARAERFLFWNKDRYVLNADIQHYWIGKEDRFWYLRTSPTGEKRFIAVDAVTGKRSPAFDQEKIAAALSKLTQTQIAASQLPFAYFRYVRDNKAIQFKLKESLFTCQLATAVCSSSQPSVGQSSMEVDSPDGKWAAFVRNHNLWVRSKSDGEEFALTSDGIEHYEYAAPLGYSLSMINQIRYGIGSPPLVRWSPDSSHILTHRLDERQVKESFFVQSVPDDGSMHPKLYAYRYALPGDEHVSLSEPIVFNVATRQKVSLATQPLISLVQTLVENRATWWSASGKEIYYLNGDRFSKSRTLNRADPVTGAVREVLRETSDTIAGDPISSPAVRVLSNGDVIWCSQRDGWAHLYYYHGATGALRNQITRGAWVVRSIVRVDEGNKRIFFTASGREPGEDPYQQHVYSVRFDGSELRLLTPEAANHESPAAFGASLDDSLSSEGEKERFSYSGRYFVDSYSRPDMPPEFVLRAANGRLIKHLEQADISKLREGGYTPIEPFQVLAADGKTPIYGNLFRPSRFDSSRKYPIIDAVYPGPGVIRTGKSFTAATFNYFEAQSLAELGFIVVTIDGRGTGYRSKEFSDYAYGRISRASDFEDHIAGIRQLAQRYPYMDIERVGIDGASGGGYAAARAILAYPDFYKVAVSAEGNHDQRGMLAGWAETMMGPMQGSNYQDVSNLPLAANLKGKLLLAHGDLDNNVPPALTMKLVDALIKADKQFDMLIIPNTGHLMFMTSAYFIHRKWDYFVRNLLSAKSPD